MSLYNLDWSDDDDQQPATPDPTFDWNAASLVAQYLVLSSSAPQAVDGATSASSRVTLAKALSAKARARRAQRRPVVRAPDRSLPREERARACVAPRPPPSC
ncbi:MAG: hypothetical protein JNK05_19240 [Myxococcales bacterium]|nr:hypothetical protein [Myxococcales bacterium]